MVTVFTGGANCCHGMFVFRYVGDRYRGRFFDSGKGGYVFRNLDRRGPFEIVSHDNRFNYLFTSGAESVMPIRIYSYQRERLIARTRRFPYHVRQAERATWRIFQWQRASGGDVRGALAAWSANKYLLGEGEDVWFTLDELASRGELSVPQYAIGPTGRAFIRPLRRKLEAFGYLRFT